MKGQEGQSQEETKDCQNIKYHIKVFKSYVHCKKKTEEPDY